MLMADFDEARDKLLLGTVRTLAIRPDERHRLAVHEAGHTLVAHFAPHADPLYKVSIIPRGRALGGTQQLPEDERHTLPEEYLRDRLAVILGGRTAEKALLETVSSGADDDIRQATALARAMVGRWGMSHEVGPVDLREVHLLGLPGAGHGVVVLLVHALQRGQVMRRDVCAPIADTRSGGQGPHPCHPALE